MASRTIGTDQYIAIYQGANPRLRLRHRPSQTAVEIHPRASLAAITHR